MAEKPWYFENHVRGMLIDFTPDTKTGAAESTLSAPAATSPAAETVRGTLAASSDQLDVVRALNVAV